MKRSIGVALAIAALVCGGIGTYGFAQVLTPADSRPVLSRKEVDGLLAQMVAEADTPQRKAALSDFTRVSPLQTKRQFILGKIAIPYDDPIPRSDPPKDMLVQAQVPIGGLSCKHRRVCVKVRCVNLPGDVNWCTDTATDCTDYSNC